MFSLSISTVNRGVAVVDVRDIAEVAAISLTEEGHEGKKMRSRLASPCLEFDGLLASNLAIPSEASRSA
jgi:hypothetical protein